MPSVLAYHRPGSLEEASALLAGPNRRVLAGGTMAVPDARRPTDNGVELIDLQGLGLDKVGASGDRLDIGALARLGDLVGNPDVPELLRDLCRRELPSTLRNQATIGGTIAAAEADSVLLAGLLVHDAEVTLHGESRLGLADYLTERPDRIITGVSIDGHGPGAIATTGRTPGDVPIVSAVARHHDDGLHLALTGVADTPILVAPGDPTASLSPTGDFRGSTDYRLHLARVLSTRAVDEVGS